MKISELKDAPQWLLEAEVKDESVEIINGKVIWHMERWNLGKWNME
jgi:hypothetical protein